MCIIKKDQKITSSDFIKLFKELFELLDLIDKGEETEYKLAVASRITEIRKGLNL